MLKRTILVLLVFISGFSHGEKMQEGKEESQRLMDSVLPFAEEMLTKHDEFFPYGGAITKNGDIV